MYSYFFATVDASFSLLVPLLDPPRRDHAAPCRALSLPSDFAARSPSPPFTHSCLFFPSPRCFTSVSAFLPPSAPSFRESSWNSPLFASQDLVPPFFLFFPLSVRCSSISRCPTNPSPDGNVFCGVMIRLRVGCSVFNVFRGRRPVESRAEEGLGIIDQLKRSFPYVVRSQIVNPLPLPKTWRAH